jgi:FlaA1/EpsC-like NDP-sugar epimerase
MNEMNWQGKRVLVTGAGGGNGSHLTETPVKLGASTKAMVYYNSSGNWGWLDRSGVKCEIEVHTGDICGRDSVVAAMESVDVVFHLATLTAIPYSYQTPDIVRAH